MIAQPFSDSFYSNPFADDKISSFQYLHLKQPVLFRHHFACLLNFDQNEQFIRLKQ
ncbi:hypothetical protein ACINWC323_1550 [Acinetobacter sp. WC-323]|nr:hypothetical protein ACINWC323_1550 [Acinetobacter sp. WC-323]